MVLKQHRMGKENESNAKDSRKRRLLRPVLPFHARPSRYHQRRGKAFGEHHRIRAGADRRLSNPVRAATHSGRGAGSRHEEPENYHSPGIRSASPRPEVPESPGGTSSGFQVQQALTGIERQVVHPPHSRSDAPPPHPPPDNTVRSCSACVYQHAGSHGSFRRAARSKERNSLPQAQPLPSFDRRLWFARRGHLSLAVGTLYRGPSCARTSRVVLATGEKSSSIPTPL